MTDLRGLNVGGGTNDIHGNTFVFGQSASPTGLLDQTPPPMDKWQGRDRELTEIRGWMAAGRVRLIGFVASGGFGKSTLVAKVYAEEAKGFEKTLWFNFSQGYSFRLWGGETLKLMGFSVEENVGKDGLVNALVNAFAQKRYLMVLDNLETLMEDDRTFKDQGYTKFLQRWLERGGRSLFLITSRERPKLVEPSDRSQWKSLGGLTTADGVKLLNDQNIQGTPTDLEEFVKVTGGHPLLLTLAIGWLRNPRLSERVDVTVVLRQDDLFRLGQLVGLHRDVETSVGAVLGESVARLNERLKGLWLALSVYRGAFGLGQAVAIEATATQEDLWNLVDRSLLQELPERQFEFLPLLQQFAAMQVGEVGEVGEAHLKAIAYYQAIAKPKPWENLKDITAYLEVFYHECQMGHYCHGYDTFQICSNFLDLRGYQNIIIECCTTLVKSWKPTEAESEKFRSTLNRLGLAYNSTSDFEKAYSLFEQILKSVEEQNNQAERANTLSNMAFVLNRLGEYEKAIEFLEEVLKIDRQVNNFQGMSKSLNLLGNALNALEQNGEALGHYQEALVLAEQVGDLREIANSLSNKGVVYSDLKKYLEAIECFSRAIELDKQTGYQEGKATSLNNLGAAYQSVGEYQKAIDFYQQSLEIERQISNRNGEAMSLGNLGAAYQSVGEYQKAIDFYQQLLEIERLIGDRRGEANSLQSLGAVYLKCGRVREGFAATEQAVQILQELDLPLEAMPYPNWLKRTLQFAQRGKGQLVICFALGIVAFPFALVGFVGLLAWRVMRGWVMRTQGRLV